MSKKDLTNCEYLFPEKQRCGQGLGNEYTMYMCDIDTRRCLWARVKLIKVWKMGDDLDLERVRECPRKEEFSEKFSGFD